MLKINIIIFLMIGLYSCKRLLCSNQVQYLFYRGNTSVYPNNDSVNVGDTIWFNSTIPEKLKWVTVNGDSVTEDFSNASDMVTNLNMSELIGQNDFRGAVDSFEFLPLKGEINPIPATPGLGKAAQYAKISSSYVCSFAIVPKKKGIYLIQILDIFKATKKCTNASVQIVYSGDDQHLHYLKDIYYGGLPLNTMIQHILTVSRYTNTYDQATGYTNQQIFNSLQSDVTRMSDLRAKLFCLYGTAQQNQVNNLFASYHY
jgi:hypothetical protein